MKQAELALRSQIRENIAIERSADALEEVAFNLSYARPLAALRPAEA
jgi:hypothetical protein